MPRASSSRARYRLGGMDLPLDDRLQHRRANHPPPHGARRRPVAAHHRRAGASWSAWSTAAATNSLWVGDHVAFTIAIFDPLLQLAQAAVMSRRLVFGTGVFLLPLRHPTPVAKQVSTLDHLTEGRFIFGVGIGGEFPKEYEACGVPHQRARRAARRKPRRPAQAVDRRAGPPCRPLLQFRATCRCSRRRASPAARRSGAAAAPIRRCGASGA